MKPETVHWIAYELRMWKGDLTTQEEWAQRQPHSETRTELFRRINFWRSILEVAHRRIASGEIQRLGGSD